jgi:hypothetical protein
MPFSFDHDELTFGTETISHPDRMSLLAFTSFGRHVAVDVEQDAAALLDTGFTHEECHSCVRKR